MSLVLRKKHDSLFDELEKSFFMGNNFSKEDIDFFNNPTHEFDIGICNLPKIDDYTLNFYTTIVESNGLDVCLLVDPDVDGYTSAAIMKQYIKSLNDTHNFTEVFHGNKDHGLTRKVMNEILTIQPDVMILTDSSSNNVDEVKLLVDSGIGVVIIDHHICEENNYNKLLNMDNVIFVNNQTDDVEVNKELTGAGMVLRFCELIDRHRTDGCCIRDDYRYYDLATLGQIADMSDISNYEIRNIVDKGLTHITSTFLMSVMVDDLISEERIVPTDLSFSIIPVINAITRVGEMEERALMFKTLSEPNNEDVFVVERRRKDKVTGKMPLIELEWDLYTLAKDIGDNVRNRQRRLVNDLEVELSITLNNDNGIVVGMLTDKKYDVIKGLTANKIVERLEKPVLILREVERDGKIFYTGSGRGCEKVVDSFKDWCINTGLVEFASGHDNAFGVEIAKEKFESFLWASNSLKQKDENIYYVDQIYHDLQDSYQHPDEIRKATDLNFYAGGDINRITFGYSNLEIDKRYINKRGSITTFWKSGVEFVFFGDVGDVVYTRAKMESGFSGTVTVDIVGEPTIDNWGGREKVRVIVNDYAFK